MNKSVKKLQIRPPSIFIDVKYFKWKQRLNDVHFTVPTKLNEKLNMFLFINKGVININKNVHFYNETSRKNILVINCTNLNIVREVSDISNS